MPNPISQRLSELAEEVRGLEYRIWGEWGLSTDPGYGSTPIGDELEAIARSLDPAAQEPVEQEALDV